MNKGNSKPAFPRQEDERTWQAGQGWPHPLYNGIKNRFLCCENTSELSSLHLSHWNPTRGPAGKSLQVPSVMRGPMLIPRLPHEIRALSRLFHQEERDEMNATLRGPPASPHEYVLIPETQNHLSEGSFRYLEPCTYNTFPSTNCRCRLIVYKRVSIEVR